MKRLTLLLLLFTCLMTNAQIYLVDNVEHTPFDISGSTFPRTDSKGNECALLKVYTSASIMNVNGGIVGKVEDKGQVKWIYLKSGTTAIDILLRSHQTLHIDFTKYGIEKMLPKATYIMTLTDEEHAQENAVLLFHKGLINYKQKDYTKAIEYFNKSASLGYNLAENNLAWMYESGLGVEKNLHKALELYQKSANNGFIPAYRKLGEFYSYGMGVPADAQKAFDSYMIAAKQKDAYSQYIIGRCYDEGIGVKKDDKQAFYWYKLGAEQGNADAQYCLACCYAIGQGTKYIDNLQAEYWLKKAAAQGHEDAKKALLKLQSSSKEEK